MLVYDKMLPRHFWKISIVTRVLPSRYSEIRRAIVRITKTKTILKRPANKFFIVKNTVQSGTPRSYHISALQIIGLVSIRQGVFLVSLLLVCINRDIFLDYDIIIDIYVHPNIQISKEDAFN